MRHKERRNKLPSNKGLFGVNPEESLLKTGTQPILALAGGNATTDTGTGPSAPPGSVGGDPGNPFPTLPILDQQ